MIKIGFPKEFNQIKALFPEKEKERDLYIVAEDTEHSRILGAVRFFYGKDQVDIFECVMMDCGEHTMLIFDGIIRTLLYKMAEQGCVAASVQELGGKFMDYFEEHHFTKADAQWVHSDYPSEFFKPCAGCSEK